MVSLVNFDDALFRSDSRVEHIRRQRVWALVTATDTFFGQRHRCIETSDSNSTKFCSDSEGDSRGCEW